MYRSADVCRLAPVGYRQFDYWCRQGAFGPLAANPGGSGSRRRSFTGIDVKVARALGRLSAAGLLGGGSGGPTHTGRLVPMILAAVEAGRPTAVLEVGYKVLVEVDLCSDDGSEP